MSAQATFAGRVEELHALFQALSHAGASEPRMVVLDGAQGSGRSTLLAEFAGRLAGRGKEVLVVNVSAPAEARYDPVELAARAATHKQIYERVGGRRRALESARELLPDWIGAIPVVGELIAAVVATVQVVRERRRKKSVSPISGDEDTDALIDAGTRRTVVLLLDDLERADRTACARIEALLRTAEGRGRLLIVGACTRAAPGSPSAPIHAMVAALPPTMVARLTLREMNPQELASWLDRRFPHIRIPASFLDWLRDETGGHPAAVEAMLGRLINRSVIRFVDRRWEVGEPPVEPAEAPQGAAPPAVDLAGIRPAVVELLEAASLIGVEFDSLALAGIAGRDELYVEDQLADAMRQGLIEAQGEVEVGDDIATRYRFRSAHLRSVLRQAVSAERRSALLRTMDAPDPSIGAG